MAKTYSKKRTVAKGRTGKKKTSGRGLKKSGASSALKLKTLVATEVQKVLNSGAQNERRKVTMEMTIEDNQVYVNGKAALNNFIRLPITDAIPAQQGVGQGPDVRRRRANKIIITGVNVRASLSVSEETRVMLLPYEPHESVRQHMEKIPLQTNPDAKAGKVPEAFGTTMVPFHMTGIVSEHGPFMTKKCGSGIALDTADDTLFESRISNHAGKPIGVPVRKKFGNGGALRRTQNWDQLGSRAAGLGYTAWTTHLVNEYWKLGRECTYMYEGQTKQVFERSVEMLMYIDCPSLESQEIKAKDEAQGGVNLVGAVIRKVIVDIYFHDK
jgi:hypothetical protein